MGELCGGEPLKMETANGGSVSMMFAKGARFEGIVRIIDSGRMRIEIRADGLQGHVVDAPYACVAEKDR
jgi:hypothetical protein